MNNWKFIAGFIGVFAVYEILVFLMWLGLKWMISPFVPTKVKLAIGIALFIVANFSIVAYMLRLGAPWVNYGKRLVLLLPKWCCHRCYFIGR